jgi:exopolysaccharide production protein ExoZ
MRTIVSVQALRAVAAMAVVLCHFNQVYLMVGGRPDAAILLFPLSSGVDLFFVISGFIMVYSSETLFGSPMAWRTFLGRRLLRIVPLYWITTAIAIPLMSLPFDWVTLTESLFFIPHRIPNDTIVPLHGVGWTLNFEMFFYAVFASFIWLARRAAITSICVALCTIAICGYYFSPHAVPFSYWSDPIILEFVFGMGIAILHRTGLQLPGWLRILLIVFGSLAVWFSAQHMPPSGLRFLLWGIPSAMVFAGTVLGRQPDFGRFAGFIKLMGDSSYALYLIHPLVGAIILLNAQILGRLFPPPLMYVVGIIFSVALAAWIWTIEKKIKSAANEGRIKTVAEAVRVTIASR